MERENLYFGSRFYRVQTRGGYIAGLSAGAATGFLGLLNLFYYPVASDIWLIGLFFFLNAVAAALLLFPGKLIATYPIAVGVGNYLRVLAPFIELRINWDEVARVYESWLRQGIVIELKRRKGVIRNIVIHWFFGPERQLLIAAIHKALQQHRGSAAG